MNLAITGAYPDTILSYPLVLISKGPLPTAENSAATVTAEGNILFTWSDNSDTGTAKSTDKAIVVAYFPNLKQAVFNIVAATRAKGPGTVANRQNTWGDRRNMDWLFEQ